MKRIKPNVEKGESFFPYVHPLTLGGDNIEISAVQSVTWSVFELDGTAVGTEDVAISSADSEGRWVANVTSDYTDFDEEYNRDFIIVFTVTFAATIGGVAKTDLVKKVKALFTIEHLPS